MVEKILLSTDIGSDIDDALSLEAILRSPIDLRGVYTVNGDVKSRAYVAKEMVALHSNADYGSRALAERKMKYDEAWKSSRERSKMLPLIRTDLSVAIGDEKAIGEAPDPYSFYIDDLVDDSFKKISGKGSDEVMLISPKKAGVNPSAMSDMERRLAEDKYTIFSIAPLTTIAKFLRRKPGLARNIERIYVMGSRTSNGGENEHNFRYDPQAAMEVLESDIPLTIVPGNLCSQYRLSVNPFEVKHQELDPLKNYVSRMMSAFLGITTARNFADSQERGLDGRDFFDWIDSRANLIRKGEPFTLSVNLNDPLEATMNPDYFKDYQRLIEAMRTHPHMKQEEREFAERKLRSFVPTEVSIADVYIPYVFLNPDRVKVEKKTIDCDHQGRTIVLPGEKHEVVTDLDWNHFRGFVEERFGYLKGERK